MSRIETKFKELKEKNKKALIAYITAGDPSLSVTEKLVYKLERSGADIIELGIPFSDPLADGPVIQASHLRALKNKVSLRMSLALVKKLRQKTQIPLVFMLSYNLIFQYGMEAFINHAGNAGLDGVIIPDLPPEEWPPIKRVDNPIDFIFLAAPTSPEERLRLIADTSQGFIYLISVTGITGKRKALSSRALPLINQIKGLTDKPVAVGFGISSPKQAGEAAKFADGVIVGSAIVDLIAKNKNPLAKVGKFVASLRRAIDANR